MLTIEQINTQSNTQVRRFIDLPYRLYANCPQWVPPLFADIELCLNRQVHPIYAHSEADFFIAVRDGRDVGRLAILTRPYEGSDEAWFHFFECENDVQAATALFERAFEWARVRGLKNIVGPKGFTMLDNSGLLIEGFEYRQVMNMTSYNYSYYANLIERIGFEKKYQSTSYHLNDQAFQLPTWVHDIAEWTRRKEGLDVQSFSTMSELRDWMPSLPKIHRNFFELKTYHGEFSLVTNAFNRIADPQLIKTIVHAEEVVAVIFAFPNLSSALQQMWGRLDPEMLNKEKQRTKGIIFHSLGISPRFWKQGLNALLFSEMEKTARQVGFQYADALTVFDSTNQMWHDLKVMGFPPSQKHGIYSKFIGH